MNTLLKKSLLIPLAVTPLFISHTALGVDSTLEYYQIYGTASTSTPRLWLDQQAAGYSDWVLLNNHTILESFSIRWDDGGIQQNPFRIETGAANNLLYLDSNERVGINKANPLETLEIATSQPGIRLDDTSAGSGQVDLEMSVNRFTIEGNSGQAFFNAETTAPSNSIYIDDTGRVGLGVVNPERDLVVGGSGDVLLENGTSDWLLYTSGVGLGFWNWDASATMPLYLAGNAPTYSLVVETSGEIGVGVLSPAAPLHVKRTDGTAKVLVQEASSAAATKRTMFELVNKGEIRFTMENTDTSIPAANRKWDFLMASDGFNISRIGSGGAELLVRNDGGVRMGNKNGGSSGFDPTFVLDPQGDLYVDGSVFPGSDVNSKENIKPIDKFAVLEKLEKLPVTEWNFIGDNQSTHIGPMAQDFYAAFGLGADDKHIGVLDASGVIIAGVQALLEKHNQLQEKHSQLKQLTTQKDLEISALQQRLDRVEAQQERLSQLEEMLRDLTVKGEVAQR